VSRRSQLSHALLVFAELGAKYDFTPDECGAMQCALAFACSTAENVMKAYRGRSRRRKKSGVARLFVFRICKTVRKDGGGKRSVSLSEVRDLLRLVYIERKERKKR
jgi:hypothetical protein